jgi:TPR repeat protein
MRETKDTMIAGRKCPTCEENLKGEWQYCPKCGKRVPPAPLEQQIADKPKPAHESEADILVKEVKQLYFQGLYGAAVRKCRLAADMDHGEAYFMMGHLVARRYGDRRDKHAMTWYKKGREKKNAAAINAIGVMHYKGDGVPKDIEEAISCFREATDLGDLYAPYNLARCYEQGIGVSQDEDKARELLYLAIGRGNEYAVDYFQAKLMNRDIEPEEEEIFDGYVLSKEYYGYLEQTRYSKNATIKTLWPIYSKDFYKKNKDLIKKCKEDYRRECLFKLPELIIM